MKTDECHHRNQPGTFHQLTELFVLRKRLSIDVHLLPRALICAKPAHSPVRPARLFAARPALLLRQHQLVCAPARAARQFRFLPCRTGQCFSLYPHLGFGQHALFAPTSPAAVPATFAHAGAQPTARLVRQWRTLLCTCARAARFAAASVPARQSVVLQQCCSKASATNNAVSSACRLVDSITPGAADGSLLCRNFFLFGLYRQAFFPIRACMASPASAASDWRWAICASTTLLAEMILLLYQQLIRAARAVRPNSACSALRCLRAATAACAS